MSRQEEPCLEIVKAVSQSGENQQIDTKNSPEAKIIVENAQPTEVQKSQKSRKAECLTQVKAIKQVVKKPKRIVLYKCKVCKTTGKKSSVKMCSKCKFHFHKQCLEPQKTEDPSKLFVCQICEKAISDSKFYKALEKQNYEKVVSSKKEQNLLQKQKEKQNSGFLNISKLMNVYRSNFKKQEWKRKLYEFYKKYPYCFQNNRVVFPIQDHLLHIYQSIFPSYCKTTTSRPKPVYEDEDIPRQFYNDLLQIQIFFSNFWEDLKNNNFYKPKGIPPKLNAQPFQMKIQDFGRKKLYKKLLREGMTNSFCDILQLLLRMYLNDVLDRSRIDNMKYISSNAFFNILATVNENQNGLSKQFIIKISPEIIKNLVKIPSFKRSFLSKLDQKDSQQINCIENLTCKNKIQIILKLIRGLCDTDCFKQMVSKKAEKMGIYTKEKGQITNELKQIQAQNLTLKQKIKIIEVQIKQLAFSDPKEYTKKYDSNTKKLQKLILVGKKNDDKISELKEKIKEIAKKIPFVNSLVKFIGLDRFKSEYFFYQNERSKIFVKYRQSYLSEQDDDSFSCYQSKQELQQLKNWLNSKGTNQKSLLLNIANLQQKEIIKFQLSAGIKSILESNQVQQIRLFNYQSVKRDQNLNSLIQCESLYRQTVREKQTLDERQKQIQSVFQILKSNDFIQNKIILEGEQEQSIWKVFFAKYSHKVWNWNQKIKKFWFEFLQIYTTDRQYQTQPNLMLLIAVFKIAMKIYHTQAQRKREKNEKKRQRQRAQRQKQMEVYHQQAISSQQQKSDQTRQKGTENGRRLLRKRQMNSDNLKDKEQQNSEEDVNFSSKKSSSNPQESSKPEKKQPKAKKLKKQISKTKKPENHKKKLQIQTQSDQITSKSKSDQNSQSEKNVHALKNDQNVDGLASAEQQLSPEQEFCQQCFENVYYQKMLKNKIVRCQECQKIYHKKCLEEQDEARFKKQPNQWRCWQCFSKNPVKTNKNTQRQSSLKGQNSKKVIINQKQLKITFQNGANTSQVKSKSKKNQKSQKKQSKRKAEEQSKIQSESAQIQDYQERKNYDNNPLSELKKRAQSKFGRPRKIPKKEVSVKATKLVQNRVKKQPKTSASEERLNLLHSQAEVRPRRSTKSKQQIIGQSSSQSEQNDQVSSSPQYNSESQVSI